MLLPEEIYELVWQKVAAKTSHIQYSRVILSLSDLLEGDFFNVYIKRGTCLPRLFVQEIISLSILPIV